MVGTRRSLPRPQFKNANLEKKILEFTHKLKLVHSTEVFSTQFKKKEKWPPEKELGQPSLQLNAAS